MSFISIADLSQGGLYDRTDPARVAAGPPPAAAPAHPGVRGFLDRVGAGLGRALDPARLAMAQALASGDGSTAAHLAAQIAAERQAQGQMMAARAQREALLRNLVTPAAQGGMGLSPGEAERALIDPEGFARAYDSRYETREIAPDHVRYQPDGGGAATTWAAPRSYEQGADIVRVDPNSGEASRIEGLTPGQQDARALNLPPGSADEAAYLRDRTLGAQGPTATGLRRQAMADRRARPAARPPRVRPVRVHSPAEAAALPSGTAFITPDGQERIRN